MLGQLALARHVMSRTDFHSFVDFMQAAVSAGLSPQTIDGMSELGFESIHDVALRSSTVDHALAAEIEVLLVMSGYKDHLEASEAARQRTRSALRPAHHEDLHWWRSEQGTRGPRDARGTTWCKICEAWKVEPVPLSTDVVEKVG